MKPNNTNFNLFLYTWCIEKNIFVGEAGLAHTKSQTIQFQGQGDLVAKQRARSQEVRELFLRHLL